MTVRPGDAEQFVQQFGHEVRPPEPQVVELLRIGQPPDAVMGKHEVVPCPHLGVGDRLRAGRNGP